MATFRVFYFYDGGLALDKNRKAKDLSTLLDKLPRKIHDNLYSVEDADGSPLCVCRVRADLREIELSPQSETEDIGIPFDKLDAYFPYRWKDGGDEVFEIYLDGRWVEFGSIDFEFYQ